MRALLLGRFQPFHRGHLNVIKDISKNYWVIIAMGSAQESHKLKNPFTAGERYKMISESLKDEGIRNYYLIPIEDINRYALWVSHVESLTPKFDVVFTRNPLTKQLFSERGYKVIEHIEYDREKYSGKEARRRMIADENWKELVPKAVVKIIKEIDGVNRLKKISKMEEYNEKRRRDWENFICK